MPQLSVLMPTHNAGRFLKLAVTSTLRAMPRDSELVVFNDLSTDGTLDVLSRIPDRRLKVVSSDKKTGVAGALEKLLNLSDSEYIGRMDSDDVCLPWRFKQQLLAIRDIDFSFTTAVFINERGRLSKLDLTGPMSPAAVPLHLLLGNTLVHPTMLARRETINSLGGYRHLPSEDYDLWLRAATRGLNIQRAGFPGILYRRHSGQLSSSIDWRASAIDSHLRESYSHLIEAKLGFRPDIDEQESWTTSGMFEGMNVRDFERFRLELERAGTSLSPAERLFFKLRRRRRLARPTRR